jgi:uncharacterized protein (TIGR02594 family)
MTQLWITEARKHIGLTEIKGERHDPEILKMWRDIKRGGIKSDEVPWCAAFVGAMLERAGIQSSRFEGAASYLPWGQPISDPVEGCVVVFSRDGGGHVGFVVGQDAGGNLQVLGGNQGDKVSIRAFPRYRAKGYRWPAGVQLPAGRLPLMTNEMSKGEA